MGYVALNSNNRVTAHSSTFIQEAGIIHEVDNEEIIDSFTDIQGIWSMEDFVFENGHLVYSPPQSKLISLEVEKLKKNLSDTDYIACKIAEGAATVEEYSVEIEQRQAWRDRINELEN